MPTKGTCSRQNFRSIQNKIASYSDKGVNHGIIVFGGLVLVRVGSALHLLCSPTLHRGWGDVYADVRGFLALGDDGRRPERFICPYATSLLTMDRHNDKYWLTVGLGLLTYNSAAAIYRSHDDPSAVAFVAVAYLVLVLLFWCLRRFETSGDTCRGKFKAAVWALSTLLTGMFSYKVAAVVPAPVAAIVYSMALAVAAGGFWAFFIYREPDSKTSNS